MIRYARWAAVSTRSQAADDRVSIDQQLELGNKAAASRGWVEASGPYVVPGESRTRWVNLRDAEEAITFDGRYPLREMLEDARGGRFDVLVLYDYTRLRELLDPVARALSAYGVQLFSVSQPVEITDPENYDTDGNETAGTIQFISGFTSRAEINALRRRYKFGMPGRLHKKGLHPGTGLPPYGYKKPEGHEMDRDAVLVPDGYKAALVVRIKDLYLAGQSTPQICETLNSEKIPPSRGLKWRPEMIAYILKNPFYAGLVRFRYSKAVHDLRTGRRKQVRNNPDNMVLDHGKHAPLWDEATYHRILEEFKTRTRAYAGKRSYVWSGLLYCSECGARLWVMYGRNRNVHYWRDVNGKHVFIREETLAARIIERMQADLSDLDHLPTPGTVDNRPRLKESLEDLQTRRQRWEDGYESGRVKLDDYERHVAELDERIKQARRDFSDAENDAFDGVARRKALIEFGSIINTVDTMQLFEKAEPQKMNSMLRSVLERIIVTPDYEIRLDWR